MQLPHCLYVFPLSLMASLLLFPAVSARMPRSLGPLSSRNITSFQGPENIEKRDATKYVFMHHIVGNTYPYTYADWASDIQAISAKGVDALALNIGSDSWQLSQITDAYKAAVGTNLKLFISFDYTAFPCDTAKTIEYVKTFSRHSNQFLYNGKPMISSYAGDCLGASGWQYVKQQTNGYLMPFIWGLEGKFNAEWSFLDSWYCWGCAWPQGNYDKTTDDDMYYYNQLGSRFATTVSMWMYTHLSDKNFYLRGDNWLINNRWDQLVGMRDKLTFVEMCTWNDYGESDYFGPFKGAQPAGTYWAEAFPHTAWFDMSEYYIKAFKTGVYPTVTKDVIYFWARPHPAAASASADQYGKPTGWDWTQDTLWAAVFATSSCSVTLTIGSSTQTFSVGYGVTKLSIPLAAGSISVRMARNSQTVINHSPSDFTYTLSPIKYNYNAYVGAATATGSASTSSSSSTSASSATFSSSSISASTSTTTSSAATSTSTAFSYYGCVAEGSSGRALTGSSYTRSDMTNALCQSLCSGFTYAATEYANECFCGNSLTNNGATGAIVSASDCSMPCAGNSGQICGGGYRLSVYTRIASSSPSSVSSTSTSSASTPTTTTWIGGSCIAEGPNGRALTGASYSRSDMTNVLCQSLCSSFAYAATEYSNECYCGNSFENGATGAAVSSSSCSSTCAGDSSKTCGGGWHLNLYSHLPATSSSASSTSSSTTTSSSVTSATTPTSTAWSGGGCVSEGSSGRALTGASYSRSDMTNTICQSLCSGFTYAATEYSNECYCGNSFQNGASGAVVSSSSCSSKCAGDSSQSCGGAYYLNVYSHLAVTATTSSSATPTTTAWSGGICISEGNNNARALTGASYSRNDMTNNVCQSLCSAFTYAATEYSNECYCGNSFQNGASGAAVSSSSCSSKCAGDSAQTCGGAYYMTLYSHLAQT